ncbi:MAG: ATP-binding protein [Gemmatimonadota bacterium]
MLKRTLQASLRKAARQHPVVTLTGPRQSGKTTLAKNAFPNSEYVSLEDPDQRSFAQEDPRGFLGRFTGSVILDEVQRAPDLFSYIQTIVDSEDRPGRFILTGSKNFLLMSTISQSLAGRAAILHLLPFSLSELEKRNPFPLAQVGTALPRGKRTTSRALMDVLFHGFYPRIHDKKLAPQDWLASYYQTYIERDVRELLTVGDLEAFGTFIRLCAGRNAQLLNLSSLANDCGISHTTARRWLSVLEMSFLVTLLRPHHRNFSKRLVKSPKIYFLDTGLLCYLLRIRSPEDLAFHALRGSVFESFLVSEFFKNYLHHGQEADLYFWRDSAGHEIDLIIERGQELIPIEAISGQTVSRDFYSGLRYWTQLSGQPQASAALVHGGDETYRREGVLTYSWRVL